MRVVVLTGAGDKAFCAGADLTGIAENAGAAAAHEGRGLLADLFRDMWSLGKPIVARVRGYALAGGFGLACACDLVVAADDAVFGTPEINVGPVAVHDHRAAAAIDAAQDRARPDDDRSARLGRRGCSASASCSGSCRSPSSTRRSTRSAAELAAKSPLIMHWGRDAFYRVLEMDADAALSYLQGMLTVTTQTEDAAEGVAAFAEKRAPQWKGR